jgi:hypothetical protein
MNIFVLHTDPQKAARYHCDKHVVKMILETAQLLSTAHHMLDNSNYANTKLYRKAYYNHPCAVWVRQSDANYKWALNLLRHLLTEFKLRYGGSHSTGEIYKYLTKLPTNIPSKELTPFAQAMPDTYKNKNAVTAYRQYYNNDKRHLFSWTHRPKPHWIMKGI